MSLQLYLGSTGSGKTYRLYQDIIAGAEEKERDYLMIVPEQFTLQTQKDIVSLSPRHGVMNIQILSFLRLAFHVFKEVGGNDYPVLEDVGKSMVLRKLLAEKKGDLVLFRANLNKPGFIDEVKSFLSELFQYNITSDSFEKMMEVTKDKPVLSGKLKDMSTIFLAFKEYIDQKYITAEEILEVLCDVIGESLWVRQSVVCFDGFTGFTPIQYKLIRRLLQITDKVMVTVTLDPREKQSKSSDYHLFGLSMKTIERLKEIATEEKIPIETDIWLNEGAVCGKQSRYANAPAISHLEHNLFRYPYQVYQKPQDNIRLCSMQTAKDETIFAAREIKRLLREEGYRYRDIAIICGNMDEYSDLIKRIFTSEQIPCFIDHKRELLLNPVVELLRSAIAVLEEEFSYESVFRYLKTGLTSVTENEIEVFENYVIATGMRGRKRYHEEFTRTAKLQDEITLEQINLIREKIIFDMAPLEEAFRKKDATIRDYTTGMVNFANTLGLPDKIDEKITEFEEKNQQIFVKEYEQVYRIILDLYDKMVMLLGEEYCSIKEYGEILDSGLTQASVGLIPPGIDTIVVGDMKRTRLNHIRALFFLGVNDGFVPAVQDGGGILSELERNLLLEHKVELAPTKRQAIFIEQYYMYLNVTKPSEKLYLTYHTMDTSTKPVRPSYFVSKITQLFKELPTELVSFDDENVDYLCEEEVGLLYLAKQLRNFPNQPLTPMFMELYLHYLNEEKTRDKVLGMVAGAFARNMESKISDEVAQKLYGDELSGSVTRLEQYAACAFAHFLSYGLRLEERREFKLMVPDIGNLFHNALDLFSKRLDESEYDWHTIPDELREEMAVACVQDAVNAYENAYLTSSKRTEYLAKRIERITIKTLWALCQQIRKGTFEPGGYEMLFYHTPTKNLKLTGRIDRLDLYETDDKVYVRVIDYKSGSTIYDVAKIYYGLQQQLAVYLSAAMDYLIKRYPQKEVVPAGIFYYHIDDPIVEKSDHQEEDILKKLKLSGLANQDTDIIGYLDSNLIGSEGKLAPNAKSRVIPVDIGKDGKVSARSNVAKTTQMLNLAKNVSDKLTKDSQEILHGNTKIEPYLMKSQSGCDYCPYHAICGFDLKVPGYAYRNLMKEDKDKMKEWLYHNPEEIIEDPKQNEKRNEE